MRIPSFVFTAALLLSGAGANAEEYPSKPIRVIVPYAAGSTGEAAFRIIANDIEARLPQRFVVESRAGAAGNLGAGFVAAAEPDGYTLLLGATNNFTINQHLYPNIGFDPLTAFAPIGVLVDLPFVAYASAALPATTLQEVATLAKQKPNSMNYASSGIGSPMQLGGVLFSQIAGIEMTHVPFRSNAQSTTALLGNEVQFYVGLIAGAAEYPIGRRSWVPDLQDQQLVGAGRATRHAFRGDRHAIARISQVALQSRRERTSAENRHGSDRQYACRIRRADPAGIRRVERRYQVGEYNAELNTPSAGDVRAAE